jgi:hypothetical protein|tara:strand:- start:1483 stop:1968 length:486 start_codon:yes stop_codon:yes gene_type:complete
MDCVDLKDEWALWFHSINDNKWGKPSYQILFNLANLYDTNLILDTFKQNHYQNGMFFVMKKDIFPNWEDPSNRMGGCLSFKISSTNVISEWKNIFLKCILDELLKDNNDKINGLSISPKKEFNIIKIWFSESIEYKNLFIDNKDSEVILSNSLYKKHVIEN